MRGIEEMIQFQCDYEEGACPQILERLMATNLEQTVGYSEDEYCKQAREKIKKACDAPEADVHFLVGGTQTNYVVIRSILRPYQGVISAVTVQNAIACATCSTPRTIITSQSVNNTYQPFCIFRTMII